MIDRKTTATVPVLVLGGGTVGVAVVERALREHDEVAFLDADPGAVEAAASLGATAEVVDVTDGRSLETVPLDVEAVPLAIVAVDRDATAFLVGQLARTKFGARTVVALIADPEHRAAFESAGMVPVCATTALADAVTVTSSLVTLWDRESPSRPTAPAGTAGPTRPRRPV